MIEKNLIDLIRVKIPLDVIKVPIFLILDRQGVDRTKPIAYSFVEVKPTTDRDIDFLFIIGVLGEI